MRHLWADLADTILATASHELDSFPRFAESGRLEFLAQLFLDIDMSILAADWDAYWKYAGQIAFEYSYLGEHAFRQGRSAFLAPCIEKGKQVFKSDAYLHLNAFALQNMETELEGLKLESKLQEASQLDL